MVGVLVHGELQNDGHNTYMSSPAMHTPNVLHIQRPTTMPPHPRKATASNAIEVVALPTLGVLADGVFIPLDPLTLKSFMNVPIRSWDDDFPELDRERYRNLKCIMPSGRLLPGLVPIVKEFDGTWDGERRISVWEDG